MHTIKGSSGMMMFDNIANISHTIEDLFYFIRESKPKKIDYSALTDLVLEGSDIIKTETEKINNDREADGDFTLFIEKAKKFLEVLKTSNEVSENSKKSKPNKIVIETNEAQKYYLSNDKSDENINLFCTTLFFEEECEMENIRCFTVIHKLKEIAEVLHFELEDIIENNETCEIIKKEGFKISFKTNSDIECVREFLMETVFLNKVDIKQVDNENKFNKSIKKKNEDVEEIIIHNIKNIEKEIPKTTHKQSLIIVDVKKLDMLMDLVGEFVISEAMVTKNPEIVGLQLDSFNKAAR